MGEPAIQTDGLSRCFGSVTAVADLNLTVERGAIHGLIGPNGAGKSTTIRLLLGLLRPTSGCATVLGYNPVSAGNEVRAHIGAVLEPSGLYERMTAWDNLDFFGRIWHIPVHERRSRSEELLEKMHLWKRRNEIVADWGRGLRQRLCIARSLMHRPALLLLDEPNAGLDSPAIDQICDYLRQQAADTGMTILMATNNLSVAESTCVDVTVLNEGRVLANGRTDHIRDRGSEPSIEVEGRGFSDEVVALLLRRPEVTAATRVDHTLRLQLAGYVDTAPLVNLLVESGVDITEVRRPKNSLKSAFCALLEGSRGEPESG